MIKVRPAADRGRTHLGWLDSRHTFSFGSYVDPERRGFRTLRVLNDDRVAPGGGFGNHPHKDMEILTYVLDGALEHKDSMGNTSVLQAGDFQRMTAGTGVTHSEFNHSPTEPAHFLQIWILPEKQGLEPSYDQHALPKSDRLGKMQLVASPDGRGDSIVIHQDVLVWVAALRHGDEIVQRTRHAWVHVAHGTVSVNGHELQEGDGLSAEDEHELVIRGVGGGEILLFDLA